MSDEYDSMSRDELLIRVKDWRQVAQDMSAEIRRLNACPRCTALTELLPGIRQRADNLGPGIANRELHHLVALIDGILTDMAGPPKVTLADSPQRTLDVDRGTV